MGKQSSLATVVMSSIFVAAAALLNPSLLGTVSAVIIVILIRLGIHERQLINPYYLFATTPASLLLYSPSVGIIFLPPLSDRVELIIILGMIAFLLGLISISRTKPRSPNTLGRKYSFIVILTLGVVPHLLGVAAAGIPILAGDVNAARAAYVLPIIGQFAIFLPVSMIVAMQRQNRQQLLIAVSLNIAFSLITAAKFSVMMSAIFLLYGYYKYDGQRLVKISPRAILLTLLVATPILFQQTFAVRETLEQSEYFWRQQVQFEWMALDRFGNFLYLPYLYLTTPWSNLSYIIEIRETFGTLEFTNGARTVLALLSVLQLDWLVGFGERPIRMPQFNTHPFISDFYLDFGLFGVVFLSFGLGLLVKWSYNSAIQKRDALLDGAWVAVGFATSLMFFSNHFTSLTYPIIALIAFNAYRKLF